MKGKVGVMFSWDVRPGRRFQVECDGARLRLLGPEKQLYDLWEALDSAIAGKAGTGRKGSFRVVRLDRRMKVTKGAPDRE